MKKFFCYILSAFAVFLVFTGCTKDEENLNGTIAGLVTETANANAPIAGASITLNTKGITKTTGSDGRYEFTDLEAGTYTLQIQANGYQSTTKQVTVYAKQTITCDVQLEKAAQSKSIIIEPANVIIDATSSEASFKLVNNTNGALDFTIANVPDFLDVSLGRGTLSLKGQQTIIVKALNRQAITEKKTAILSVNIGNDSYAVNITVEAFKTEQMDVKVTPATLSFNTLTNDQYITIENNNTYEHPFTISSDLSDILSFSMSEGTLKAKTTMSYMERIKVTVTDRSTLTSNRTGEITILVSGTKYTIPITVSAEQPNITVSPTSLSFDTDTNELSFTISNNNSFSQDYSITSTYITDVVSITPLSGTVLSKGTATIMVQVIKRSTVTDRSGTITVTIGGNTYNVHVNVVKENGSDPSPTPSDDVTRGLQAYYTFDDSNADDSRDNYHGFVNGNVSYVTDTPNGSGKALYLKQRSYISIGSAPLDGKKTFSVSMWVKDFGTSSLLKAMGSNYFFGGTLLVTESLKLRYYTNKSNSGTPYLDFSADMSNYQSGQWVMITVVTEQTNTYNATSTLYINGRRADAGTSNVSTNSGATSMMIGGQTGTQSSSAWSDPMKVDNVRIYSVALTDDEVSTIYNLEK